MRVVLQRSKKASVTVDGEIVGQIPFGLTLLVGITHEDTEKMQLTLRKNCKLTYFEDESGKMNHSVLDVEGQVLSISQFTLYGDCRKGRRPNFMDAKPDYAERLYDFFNEEVRKQGLHVETGKFEQ